jgi:tryptophanyl-tRNA synthetase
VRARRSQDGTSKMSKSAENDASRINLTDDAATIASKIKRCKTDAVDGLEFGNPDRPEANNLLILYQLATGKSKVRRVVEGSEGLTPRC